MATWRVFKKDEDTYAEISNVGEIVAWIEYPPLESEYGSWVTADEVGPVAGAGQYLLIGEDTYPRVIEIEVRALTRYEEVEQPEPDLPTEVLEPGFSVAVTDEQPTAVRFYADEQQ